MDTIASAFPQDWPFDPDLLRRYDRPGPRYTSYPTAPQFLPGFGEVDLQELARRGNDDPIPRQLSLYVHVPFCRSPCFYCGCNRIITRDEARGQVYLDRLHREIAMVAPLFDADREVVQLHLGGGTPNFLGPGQIAELVESLGAHFRFSQDPARDFSIELDPRFVTPDDIGRLAEIGFNRASLGVQDFDPVVQAAVNRIQSVEQTLEIIEASRRYGMRSLNVDLIYGLPKQTLEGFGRTLDTVMQARPDRLAIYGYAHLPDVFRPQRQIDAATLPAPEEKLALLGLAVEKLAAAGYRYVGMDHFALPDDELARAQREGGLHRNFMGYTTHAQTDLVGLGVSAISHVGDSFSQNHRGLTEWEAAIDAGTLPIWRGLVLGHDDVLRADLIQRLMCQGEIDIGAIERAYDLDFAAYFAGELAALAPLQADALVECTPTRIRATSRGRPLLRIIAMCFDRYLQKPSEQPRYSRTI
ncbi:MULTISPECIES: oxygen-independent coproporphyrinogen III oxidase [unclassified Luteimonas]|jgi:oxygen-independent coproporphyrinogen III oxidase|uniref:oxygen-independent coproporphyrinogen III oxidase n=1 Tax=unclassified Luteimonas TaxID=2629088 RepID=UPI000B8D484C|nr:oxygen-independent coproporphyrinogen III oxidase [Luteimonas sp. RC10]ASR42327.1 oxygen-independent coproporphyrinogen III oxidase [Xanthomonas citri pv. mangiferaeindicae]MBB3343516.1 oxygen-independent coproporphyrinogen-3 oxidase [Luteimonas sp. RC10]